MFSVQRYALYFTLAVCILITLTYYRADFWSPSPHHAHFPSAGTDSKPQHLGAGSADKNFQWRTVPTNYPVTSFTPLPTDKPLKLPKIQHDFPKENQEQSKKRKERQATVRKSFERTWNAYRQHAWLKDELAPLSGGTKGTNYRTDPPSLFRNTLTPFANGFGGWGASLVDNLDNLWIMGFKDAFEQALSASMEIDTGSATIDSVNTFETTIRHLGGFLACYDLSEDERCLHKATEFGEMLYKAFDTPNRMPIARWRISEATQGKQEADKVILLAELGSFTMEFTRLSVLTGDPKWYDAVNRITRLLAAEQSKTYIPGMWPVVVNARAPDLTADTWFTLGAMADSVYEYFPKMHALLGGVDAVYKQLYTGSMSAAIKHTIYRPMTPDSADILVAGGARAHSRQGPVLDARGEHLVCFAGGMLALGGKLFDLPEHVEVGRKLTDGCIWSYKSLPLGVMPEVFQMVPCHDKLHCDWNETRWREEVSNHIATGAIEDLDEYIRNARIPKGFAQISDPRYILRPEAIESVFMMYRITGEQKYQEAAWDMFTAIIQSSETALANAALSDITYKREQIKKEGISIQEDSMESFWMAETLKYFYLIFSEPDIVSLDQWMFNTEAHPFKRNL